MERRLQTLWQVWVVVVVDVFYLKKTSKENMHGENWKQFANLRWLTMVDANIRTRGSDN